MKKIAKSGRRDWSALLAEHAEELPEGYTPGALRQAVLRLNND